MKDKELQKVAKLLQSFFKPIISASQSSSSAFKLMLELGYIPPEEFKVFEKLKASTNAVKSIFTFIEGIREDDIESDPELIIKTILDLTEEIKMLIDYLKDLSSFFQSELNGSGLLTQTNILTEITRKLVDFLIIKYLEENHYRLYSILRLFSIIEVNDIEEVPNEFEFPHLERIFYWERNEKIFSDPLDLLKTSLRDEDSYFYYQTIYALQELGNSLGLIPHYRDPDLDVLRFINNNSTIENWSGFEDLEILRFALIPNIIESAGIDVYPLIDTVNDKFTGLVLGLGVDPEQREFDVTDKFKLQLEFSANANNGLGFSIDQNDEFKFIADLFSSPRNLSDNIQLEFKAKLIGESHIVEEEEDKFFRIGTANGNRFEIGSFNLAFGIVKEQDVRLYIETELLNGLIAIDFSEGDGFISKIIGDGIESNFNLGIGFSNKQGLYFTGSSSLEIVLPTHINLGIIEIQDLLIGVFSKEEKITFEFGSTLLVNLGPLKIILENIGMSLPDQRNSNLETIIPKLGFKPPTGVGLSINAGAVKGGGYLRFDHDREEYDGTLELVFSEWITLKAIGLITTKMPDGSKGFSMLIIITAEFGEGIQLGFGFTLLAVGDLLGLNRTVKIEPLAEGIQIGSVETVMFPQNIVANAPRIISDLKRFFPVLEGQFLVGPMAKIGYGTPTFLRLSLGVIIEFPTVSITILGVLKVALPDEDAEVLKLNVKFIGRIEPSNKLLWFYAELFDSRILSFTLEGGMGLLVNWGDQSNFVISVGGFHPRYTPPPLPFPEPPRLAINLLNEPNAKIRVEGYFAVTSNTVQFGARAELYFEFSAFRVEGFISFDALFQFDPFYFIFEFSVGMAVKVFGFGLFTFSVSGMLEGPTKWHLKGSAKKKITWLGSTIRVPIDVTWGEERQTELTPIEILPLIEREFAAISNWEAVVPANTNILVTLRKLGEPTAGTADAAETDTTKLVLHPVGKLRISQWKIPLNLELDKLGNQRPSDVNRLSVTADITGGVELVTPYVKEKFATGEFRDLNESSKLSSPGFVLYDSGIEIRPAGEQLKTSKAVKRIIRYETIIIDDNFKRHQIPFFKPVLVAFSRFYATMFGHLLKGNAVTKSTLSNNYRKRMQPNEALIKVSSNQYSIAYNETNKPVDSEAMTFNSHANAVDYLREQIRKDPNAAAKMHVIPNTEINTAA